MPTAELVRDMPALPGDVPSDNDLGSDAKPLHTRTIVGSDLRRFMAPGLG